MRFDVRRACVIGSLLAVVAVNVCELPRHGHAPVPESALGLLTPGERHVTSTCEGNAIKSPTPSESTSDTPAAPVDTQPLPPAVAPPAPASS